MCFPHPHNAVVSIDLNCTWLSGDIVGVCHMTAGHMTAVSGDHRKIAGSVPVDR